MNDLLIGIDVGTTFCKAAVVDAGGRELAHGRAPTPWVTVPTGAEVSPDALVGAALDASGAALEAVAAKGVRGRVVGVGVASMAETGVLLGGDGRPVAASIAWHDARGDAEAERLGRALGARRFVETAGLPVRKLCSAAKYAWLKGHVPEAGSGVRWLNVAEWVVRRLGGAEACELSLASRTGWLDRVNRRWWGEALEASGAPDSLLPDLVEAGSHLGEVTVGPSALRGAALTVAGHDHVCAALGAGIVVGAEVFNSCGTAEAYVRSVAAPVPARAAAQAVAGGVAAGCHVLPGRDALMGGFSSGLILDRWLGLLGVSEEGRAQLDAAALELRSHDAALEFAELTGERAVLMGMASGASPAHVWRALLEALARRGRAVLDTIERVSGPAAALVVTGGVARSSAVREVKRRVVAPITVAPVDEAGARGAALLGGCAAGLYRDAGSVPPPPRDGHSR